jgi:hypothetical protein
MNTVAYKTRNGDATERIGRGGIFAVHATINNNRIVLTLNAYVAPRPTIVVIILENTQPILLRSENLKLQV